MYAWENYDMEFVSSLGGMQIERLEAKLFPVNQLLRGYSHGEHSTNNPTPKYSLLSPTS